MNLGIVSVYCGKSGKKGFYNSQELGLAKAMKKLGFKVFVFFPDTYTKVVSEIRYEEYITAVYVPAYSVGVSAMFDWSIINVYGIDVVQIGSDNHLFASDCIRYCDKKGIPIYNYIGTIQSDSNICLKRAVSTLLSKRNIREYRIHKCFAKTESAKKQLEKYGITDVEVAPVGLDLSVIPEICESRTELRERLNLPIDKKILVFVGRMDEYKRPKEALKLMSLLSADHYLIMIGTGSLDNEVDSEIETLKLSNRVRRIKSIPNAEIHRYYKAADYFLNFNEKEIFGMSILEAMYQNCTVIAINAPGPREIIENGKTGFIALSVDEMKNIINKGLKIDSNTARNAIVALFSWSSTAEQFASWIEKNIRN